MSRHFPPSNSPEEKFFVIFFGALFHEAREKKEAGKSERRKFLSLSVILFFPFTYCRFSEPRVASRKHLLAKTSIDVSEINLPFCRSSLTFALEACG
jgi:hypothetical protein